MVRVKVDVSEFVRESKKFIGEEYPRAVATGLEKAASNLQRFEQANARQQFHLHSDWIPNNILRYPSTRAQIQRIKSDIVHKHSAYASVFASKHITWLGIHEEGGIRSPHSYGKPGDSGKKLAIPVNSAGRSLKNVLGSTKKRWQPSELLRNSINPWVKGSKHPGERGNGTRKPFILRSGGKSYIARRQKGVHTLFGLEIIYHFSNKAEIKPTWKFESRGEAFANMDAKRSMEYCLRRLSR